MTSQTPQEQHPFVAYLIRLTGEGHADKKNLAALAALRRGLGKPPGEVAVMFPYVMPWVGDLPLWRQNTYFLVAALFAEHQLAWQPADAYDRQTNLGASFRALHAKPKADSGSIEKRFVALLSAEREDLPAHLRHAMSLLKAHDIYVNWTRLLSDLDNWRSEERRVQRAWAATYWRESWTALPTQG